MSGVDSWLARDMKKAADGAAAVGDALQGVLSPLEVARVCGHKEGTGGGFQRAARWGK